MILGQDDIETYVKRAIKKAVLPYKEKIKTLEEKIKTLKYKSLPENKIQKVYNSDTKELYGEFDIFELIKLRIKYVKGKIPETLCYIDENDRMYRWDEFAVEEQHLHTSIDTKYTNLIRDLSKEQCRKRVNECKIDPNNPESLKL